MAAEPTNRNAIFLIDVDGPDSGLSLHPVADGKRAHPKTIFPDLPTDESPRGVTQGTVGERGSRSTNVIGLSVAPEEDDAHRFHPESEFS